MGTFPYPVKLCFPQWTDDCERRVVVADLVSLSEKQSEDCDTAECGGYEGVVDRDHQDERDVSEGMFQLLLFHAFF